MFVRNLNIEQQSVLLYLTLEVIKADENLHELQLNVMEILRSQMEKNVQSLKVEVEQLLSIFPDNTSKCSALLELIAIAQSNNEYHENEKALIRTYANNLDINDEKLSSLENWVTKQIELSKQIQEIIA